MSDRRAVLRELAEALPDGAAVSVPRSWLLEILDEMPGGRPATLAADLTVAQLAQRYGRKPSAARAWLERGDFPGAYKLHGREWRAPPAAVAAFDERQRRGGGKPSPPPGGLLSDWRHERAG